MSRPKIVAGNWKMNKTLVEAVALASEVVSASQHITSVEKIFFVPFPFLNEVASVTSDHPGFYTGAQNCSEHASGAYTGEVAASMLASVGCGYVLSGHSERRQYFSETAEQQKAKIRLALDHHIKVIYCVGEKLAERRAGSHFDVVSAQIAEVLKGFGPDDLKTIYLAYEPVWAIGTGETATPAQAQEMHAFIRKTLGGLFGGSVADAMPLLYGGSCNAQNAAELFACPDVDGGLIGGASLKAADFCKIIASF